MLEGGLKRKSVIQHKEEKYFSRGGGREENGRGCSRATIGSRGRLHRIAERLIVISGYLDESTGGTFSRLAAGGSSSPWGERAERDIER